MELTIDCGTCSRRETSVCGECVMTYILFGSAGEIPEPADQEDLNPQAPSRQKPDRDRKKPRRDSVVIDAAEFFAIRRLQAHGLVPELQHDKPTTTETG